MMGWTLKELDQQDMTRIYDGLSAAGLRDALMRVQAWVETHGKVYVGKHDWTLWKIAMDSVKHD